MTEIVAAPCKRYGPPPYRLAVLHGGPGAPGAMAPVARVVSRSGWGVLEPWQTALTVEGQIEELAACLGETASGPVTCIGHSWGAWLGLLVAARHPACVRQLILVGCPPLTPRHAAGIDATRLSRLSPAAQREVRALLEAGPSLDDAGLARLGALLGQADAYDPLPPEAGDAPVAVQGALFTAVWPQAARLRQSGELLRRARALRCPVLAIHGDYDPHPVAGILTPLADRPFFRSVVLPRCGHTPWQERQAREAFFSVLAASLADGDVSADI